MSFWEEHLVSDRAGEAPLIPRIVCSEVLVR
jgi:hypothetical protein